MASYHEITLAKIEDTKWQNGHARHAYMGCRRQAFGCQTIVLLRLTPIMTHDSIMPWKAIAIPCTIQLTAIEAQRQKENS